MKVTSRGMLERIASSGSDPARYAFRDARVLVTKHDAIGALLARVARFPAEQRADREHRFLCQVLAWTWYLGEAESHGNAYLTTVATHKLVLFACRVVLNANGSPYPYHEWLLRGTERAPRRPEGVEAMVADLLARPTPAAGQRLRDAIPGFAGVSAAALDWPNLFLRDSELNWLDHGVLEDDL